MYAPHIESAICAKLNKEFGYGIRLTSLDTLMVVLGDSPLEADLTAEILVFEDFNDYYVSEPEMFLTVGQSYLDQMALNVIQEMTADLLEAA